jgi:hypothetical protein
MISDAKLAETTQIEFDLGKRDAVRHKSGSRLTTPTGAEGTNTLKKAGRKPDACPVVSQGGAVPPCASAQSGKAGRSPAAVACSSELDRDSIDAFIAVFRLLDEWERNLYGSKVM